MGREIRNFRMKYFIMAEFLKNNETQIFLTFKYGSEVDISHG